LILKSPFIRFDIDGAIAFTRAGKEAERQSAIERRRNSRRAELGRHWRAGFAAGIFRDYPWVAEIEARFELHLTPSHGVFDLDITGNLYPKALVEGSPTPFELKHYEEKGFLTYREDKEQFVHAEQFEIFCIPSHVHEVFKRSDVQAQIGW
jgi:hypothetical protein